MSQPPPRWPSDEPQDPHGGVPQQPPSPPPAQPGQWQAPPAQPGQWQAPPAQPGQWQAPPAQPGQWQEPGHWPAPSPQGGFNPPGAAGPRDWEALGAAYERPKRGGRGRLIAAVVVVLALAGGGVATYIAVSDRTSHNGAGSPNAAVKTIVDDINKSDLVGMLGDLAPAERDAIATPLLNDIKELKRINVLDQKADPKNVGALKPSIKNLTFSSTVKINDHVQIVQLTGGTVSISADVSKIPFTSDFIQALFPNGAPAGQSTTNVDIGAAVKGNGGKPIRIATEKVGGHWYPSLFYTIADNGTRSSGLAAPTTADFVPAKGASSPEEAVKQTVMALLKGDVKRAIELVSPEELAVVHDYAGLIMKNVGSSYPAAPIHIEDLQLTTKPASGGAQTVTLKSLSATTDNGDHVTVTLDGDCVELTLPGKSAQRVCASQAVTQIENLLTTFGQPPLTAAQKQALNDLFGGSTSAGGIITTQSGGQWYVNPVRTLFEGSTTVLKRLKDNDVLELIRLVTRFTSR